MLKEVIHNFNSLVYYTTLSTTGKCCSVGFIGMGMI